MTALEWVFIGILALEFMALVYVLRLLWATRDGRVRVALIIVFSAYALAILTTITHALCRMLVPAWLDVVRVGLYVLHGVCLVALAWFAFTLRPLGRREVKGDD